MDSLIFKICGVLSPVYYFVGTKFFRYKKEAIDYIYEHELPPEDIVKVECLTTPDKIQSIVNMMVRSTTKKTLADVEHYCNTDNVTLQWFMGGEGNFRYEVDSTYKGTRGEKPFYTGIVKEMLIKATGATIVDAIETDDAVALLQRKNTIISTIDKDLLNVPGWHYNPNTRSVQKLKPIESFRLFLTQCVTGDTTDNIKGIKGLGKVKAKDIVSRVEGTKAVAMWISFLTILHTEVNDFDEEALLRDAILLDMGFYWSKKLGLPNPHIHLGDKYGI